MAVEITVQTDPVGNIAPQSVLLPEPIHLRRVKPRAEVNHAGRGVVVFSVVAEAGSLFRKQFAKGRIRFAYDVLSRQSAAEGVPGVVIRDFRRNASSAVVNVLRAGASGLCGDALQAVGITGLLPVLGSRDDHAIPIQNIPCERGCQIFVCADFA